MNRDELQNQICRNSYPREALMLMQELGESFEAPFIAARSSHVNEHEGSGRYYSGFGSSDEIAEQAKRVVMQAADPAMAVLVQPVIGKGNDYSFHPPVAGYAYSTRLANSGEGKIGIVYGLGVKAVTDGADVYFFNGKNISQTEKNPNPENEYWVQMEGLNVVGPCYFDPKIKDRVVKELAEKLKLLERILGKPVYVEFALGGDNNVYILQISETVPIEQERFEFSRRGLVSRGNVVSGVQKAELRGVLWTFDAEPFHTPHSIEAKNPELKNYLLILSSEMFSDANGNKQFIGREYAPNAGGVLVICNHDSFEKAGNHAKESMRGIPFMVSREIGFLDRLQAKRLGDWNYADARFLYEVDESKGFGQLSLLG